MFNTMQIVVILHSYRNSNKKTVGKCSIIFPSGFHVHWVEFSGGIWIWREIKADRIHQISLQSRRGGNKRFSKEFGGCLNV